MTTSAPFSVGSFATHFLPHFDEVFALFLFWNFEHPDFPGADEAAVQFFNAGRRTPQGGYATEDWVRAHSQLPIGIWGGSLDEHRREEETDEAYEARKKEQECAASLAAKMLGLDQRPELQSLLRFARRVDNTATADPHDISSVIKRLHDNRDTPPGKVRRWVNDQAKLARINVILSRQITLAEVFLWVEQGIYAKCLEGPSDPEVDDFRIERIATLLSQMTPEQSENNAFSPERWLEIGTDALELDQLLFETVTAGEYTAYKTLIPFQGQDRQGKPIEMKIAVVTSDDVRIHRYARFTDRVAVTIQRRMNGSVVIQSTKGLRLNMRNVARALKVTEAELRGVEPPRWDKAGKELLHSVWHFFAVGGALFNGSKTAPDMDPTRIKLGDIARLVKMALSNDPFEPSRFEQCAQGICTSTLSKPCPRYKYGFGQCQTIRWEARRDREATASGK